MIFAISSAAIRQRVWLCWIKFGSMLCFSAVITAAWCRQITEEWIFIWIKTTLILRTPEGNLSWSGRNIKVFESTTTDINMMEMRMYRRSAAIAEILCLVTPAPVLMLRRNETWLERPKRQGKFNIPLSILRCRFQNSPFCTSFGFSLGPDRWRCWKLWPKSVAEIMTPPKVEIFGAPSGVSASASEILDSSIPFSNAYSEEGRFVCIYRSC